MSGRDQAPVIHRRALQAPVIRRRALQAPVIRRRALLVAPLLPQAGGNGLAMRAGMFLDALAAEHEVTLLVVPVAGGGSPEFARRRAARVEVLPLADGLDPLFALSASRRAAAERQAALLAYPRPRLCAWATSRTAALAAEAVRQGGTEAAPFSVVVVLRSYLAPYAARFLDLAAAAGGSRILDLDDDERLTQSRLAALYERRGAPEDAALARAEAEKYARHEAAWLPRFSLLLAVSDLHAAAVAGRFPAAAVEVVPNAVEVWPAAAPAPAAAPGAAMVRLLLVGNLSYEPNIDGALWLAAEVLPRLRAAGLAVELRLAGSRPAAAVAALAAPGIEVHADPADLAAHYAWADVALAPIHAGGGTRIKILEAGAAAVPVVATPVGAEGLAHRDGEHILLAASAEAFAAACALLAHDRRLAGRLAGAALELVRRCYARPDAVRRIQELVAAGGS